MSDIIQAALDPGDLAQQRLTQLIDIFPAHLQVRQDPPQDIPPAVFRDDIVRRIAAAVLENGKKDCMEGPETDRKLVSLHQRNKTLPHFICGSSCKCHNQYL